MGCERPGLWLIEGHRVERIHADGKVWWQVHSLDGFIGKERTLTEACTLIDDAMYRRQFPS